MNTGDSPSQQSEAGVVAQPDWRPGADLTALEYEIVRNAEIGRLAGVRDGEYDLAAMRTWGQGQTVRATVLRHLLVDEEWPVHSRGVRLRAVRISGRLDLEAATVRCPLILNYCYFDEPVPVNLSYATVPWLHFTGCYLAGLTGVMLKVTKDLAERGVKVMCFLAFALAVAITAPRVRLYSLPAAAAVALATAAVTWRHMNAPA